MKQRLLTGKFVLVYQMPKTASQTVEATLQNAGLPYPVMRTHYLSKSMCEHARASLERPGVGEEWKRQTREQIEFSERLSGVLRRRKSLGTFAPLPKVLVTCAVRELIGLGLSSCFENTDFLAPDHGSLSPELCRETLMRPRMFKFLDNWFDWELKAHFGIDVFARPFPQAEGYAIYENRFARVLVYRLENADRLPAMLSELLRRPVAGLVNRNTGSEKSYAAEYQFAREHLALPAEFVRERYRAKIMTHFYSVSELAEFERRWTRPVQAFSF